MGNSLGVACLLTAILSIVVSAENKIKFINHCPYDVYAWAVGPAGSGLEGKDYQAVTIPANTVTYQDMANCELTKGGISVKLRDLPHYEVAPAGIIQVEYNLVPGQNHLWYDLSAIDCNHSVGPENPSFCPLVSGGMKVYVDNADEGKCPPAWCDADGQCHNTYKEHGSWQGEPSFRCDAGKDISVEFCIAHAGPRTFNGHNEPGHHEPQPDKKPGNPTTNGVCGAKTPDGATCYGYVHGDCCSQYGWCGSTDGHCGTDCQSGFGNCTSDIDAKPDSHQHLGHSSSYSSPGKSNTLHTIYSWPTPAYSKSTSGYSKSAHSYHPPAPGHTSSASTYHSSSTSCHPILSSSSPSAPNLYLPPSSHRRPSKTYTSRYSHIEHPWPSYGKPSSTYVKPSALKSTPAYSKPTLGYEKPSSSYIVLSSSYVPPVKTSGSPVYYPAPNHSYSAPLNSKTSSSCNTPSHSRSTPVHSRPASSYVTPSDIESAPVYGKPYTSYAHPGHSISTPTSSAPVYSKSTRSIYTPTYSPPPYTKPTSAYSKPLRSISTPMYQAPSLSKSTPVYSEPSSSYVRPTYTESSYKPLYSPPYIPPPFRTIYATHTITETRPHIIKTVTVSITSEYQAPSSWYSTRPHSTLGYEKPSHTHIPQQEPRIPSTWYKKSVVSSAYTTPTIFSQYHEPPVSENSASPPTYWQPWYDPPLPPIVEI